jgi:hypothetical protein
MAAASALATAATPLFAGFNIYQHQQYRAI